MAKHTYGAGRGSSWAPLTAERRIDQAEVREERSNAFGHGSSTSPPGRGQRWVGSSLIERELVSVRYGRGAEASSVRSLICFLLRDCRSTRRRSRPTRF